MKPPLPLPPSPRLEPLARDPRNYRRHVDAVLGAAERRAYSERRLRMACRFAVIGGIVALGLLAAGMYAPLDWLPIFAP